MVSARLGVNVWLVLGDRVGVWNVVCSVVSSVSVKSLGVVRRSGMTQSQISTVCVWSAIVAIDEGLGVESKMFCHSLSEFAGIGSRAGSNGCEEVSTGSDDLREQMTCVRRDAKPGYRTNTSALLTGVWWEVQRGDLECVTEWIVRELDENRRSGVLTRIESVRRGR